MNIVNGKPSLILTNEAQKWMPSYETGIAFFYSSQTNGVEGYVYLGCLEKL